MTATIEAGRGGKHKQETQGRKYAVFPQQVSRTLVQWRGSEEDIRGKGGEKKWERVRSRVATESGD